MPEPVRGRSFAVVMAAFLGSEADGRELLRPLRALGPEMDTFAMQPPVALSELAMDPRDPLPFRMRARARRRAAERPRSRTSRGSAGPARRSRCVQLRHMGGALGRRAPGAGARATLPGEICVFGLGVVPDAAAEPAVRAELDALSAAVAPHRAGDYPNFVEEPADASAFFDTGTWERLRRSRRSTTPRTCSGATTTSRRPESTANRKRHDP